ncbi:MAG TPA: hypothetical protein EYP14_04755, partial [Planctomycetaceae bacterium]|nr:hypothetical protein [Planctomycetaceae bacterium]
ESDVLVVAKKADHEQLLDHLAGAVGDIRSGSVQFLLDNQTVPIQFSKLFGIIFYRRPPNRPAASCRIDLCGGGWLWARSASLDGENLTMNLDAVRVTAPLSAVAAMDFSFSNVRYLSDMEPRRVEYTPYFDIVWKYRRDENLDGAPLRVDGRTFARGLCIHSRTVLQYDLNGNFRRFLAVMGIDQAVRPLGDVHVTIRGDGRTLLDVDVHGADPARIVDLDVTGVRTLQIRVDFGKNLDIADHLDLADAKVVK